jgi:hypothetical protein
MKKEGARGMKTETEKQEALLRELAALDARIHVREREHEWEMAQLKNRRKEITKMIDEQLSIRMITEKIKK